MHRRQGITRTPKQQLQINPAGQVESAKQEISESSFWNGRRQRRPAHSQHLENPNEFLQPEHAAGEPRKFGANDRAILQRSNGRKVLQTQPPDAPDKAVSGVSLFQ